MNRRLTPMAAALLAAFASPIALQQSALAQTKQTEATMPEVQVRSTAVNNDYAPDVSTIGGKAPTPIRDIPQSVTVIKRSVLEAQAASTMTEALRNVPGITISAGEGGAIGDNVNLRGFSARTDIFLDGFRDRGQYTRDTFSLEAVEVLKGPSSMLFGRGSTGGVINQVSKKPGLKPISEVTASVGTNDFYRTTVDLNRPLSETSAFRIEAFAQDTRSTRDVVHNRDFGVAPSLRLGIGTPTEITLSGLFQRNKDTPDYGIPFVTTNGPGTVSKPVSAPANRFYGYTDDRFDQSVNVLSATIRHKISPTLTLRNQTQYNYYTTDASPSPLGAVTRIGGGTPSQTDPLNILTAPRQDRDRYLAEKSFSNQTDLIAKLQTGSVAHTVTTGLEIGRDWYSEDRYVWNTSNADRTINLGNPVNGTRQGARALSRTVNTTADTLAAYVNDQMDLTKRWKVVGGLRWDRFKVGSTLQKYALPAGFPADTTLTSVPNTDTMLSTRAGVIYQPNEAQSYYISYGTSFNPSAEGVSQSASTAALDPEKNRSIEAGAKLDFLNGNLTVNGAVFRVDKTNARTTDPLSGLVTLNGDIRVQGVELGIVGRITPAWQVMAGYTFLDGKVVSSLNRTGSGTAASPYIYSQGKTLQNTPRHSASVWSTYSFMGNWEAGGGLIYSSQRFVNNFESTVIDGYTRFDATLAYKQKDYDIRLNLQNLTDAKYFETASGGRATPVKGRSAIVTLAYRF
ncbi:MAG: TonB-dependent siderophore receptor [Burkholderiales bacterium]|nr:TonB-dependent siderophore receptor [Burkholderiales bacterium]